MYTELTDKTVFCRKSHNCVWCGEKIKKREKCRYRSYIFGGKLVWGWMHLECYTAMCNEVSDLTSGDIESGFSAGQFKRGSSECA